MEASVRVPEGAERVVMLGPGDRNLKMIREGLGVRITARGDRVRVEGESEQVIAAQGVLEQLGQSAQRNEHMSRQEVLDLIGEAANGKVRGKPGWRTARESGGGRRARSSERDEPAVQTGAAWDGELDVYAAGRPVGAKTSNQERYLEAIRDHDLVFGIGPAGTGKTYLAVAAAVHMLKTERVKRVILVRPAVEAGEKLGFLPGDLQAKVNPYLRPLLDALHDMMDFPTIQRFMVNDVVEVIPLAYMRGRTLNNAVIILDEAQNTTRGQMQMFLTRMGNGSKMIVTGDVTQIDLPDPTTSGLVDAARRLVRVPGIAFVTMDRGDIVRHPLVQRIVEAYGSDGNSPSQAGAAQNGSAERSG